MMMELFLLLPLSLWLMNCTLLVDRLPSPSISPTVNMLTNSERPHGSGQPSPPNQCQQTGCLHDDPPDTSIEAQLRVEINLYVCLCVCVCVLPHGFVNKLSENVFYCEGINARAPEWMHHFAWGELDSQQHLVCCGCEEKNKVLKHTNVWLDTREHACVCQRESERKKKWRHILQYFNHPRAQLPRKRVGEFV